MKYNNKSMIEYIHFILMNSDTAGARLYFSCVAIVYDIRSQAEYRDIVICEAYTACATDSLIELVIQFLHVLFAIQQQETVTWCRFWFTQCWHKSYTDTNILSTLFFSLFMINI